MRKLPDLDLPKSSNNRVAQIPLQAELPLGVSKNTRPERKVYNDSVDDFGRVDLNIDRDLQI